MKKNAITPNDVNMVNSWLHNPWPGLSPYKDPSEYKDGVRYKFCGRSAETYDLLQMIETRNVVTLYGSTGVGKTSLLRAGVFPLLKQHVDVSRKDHAKVKFCPVYIRLGAPKQLENLSKEDYESMSLSELMTLCLEKVLEVRVTGSIGSTDGKRWLWYYFHSRSFYSDGHQVTPVIVLDQFEELFARKENDNRIKEFLKQLYVLAGNRVLWSGEEGLHEAAFRFVITLREDRFFYLEDCIDALRLNLFKENRYRLRPLEDGPAQQIVTIPGRDIIDKEREEEISSLIINKARNKERGDINTLMLSLICTQLYSRYGWLSLDTVRDISLTLDSYYESAIKGIPSKEVKYFENNFINGDNRQPVEESVFKKKAPVAYKLFYRDEDSPYKIITDVVVPGKTTNHVELIHDQLASVINARQKEISIKWQSRAMQVGIIMFMVLVCLGVIYTGQITKNKEWQTIGMMQLEAHEFSTSDSLWIDQVCLKNNAMVERLSIEAKTKYCIEACPYLHTIDLTLLGRDSLYLTLTNCNLLEHIVLPPSLAYLSLKISNCPKLELVINKGLGELDIAPMKEYLYIRITKDVKRYIEKNGVLWDLHDRRVVHYPRAEADGVKGQTFSYSFPSSIKDEQLNYGAVKLTNIEYKETDESRSWSRSDLYLTSYSQTRIDQLAKANKEEANGYVLPSKLDSLPSGIFKSHVKLDSVVLPDTLFHIGSEAFMECRRLKNIILPPTLESIGNRSFYGCNSLERIVIPRSVKTIGNNAFEGCTSLKSVVFLGDSILLGNRSFANCPMLKSPKLPIITNSEAGSAFEDPFYNGNDENFSKLENGYEVVRNADGSADIRLYDKVSEIYLNYHHVTTFNVLPDAHNLYHIHIPWAQPVQTQNNKRYELGFKISKEDMQHITLHVPYGRKRYYELEGNFEGFQNIVEDPESQQTKNWISELFHIGKRECSKPLSIILIVLCVAVLAVISVSVQRMFWEQAHLCKKQSWIKVIMVTSAFCVIVAIFYALLFWFMALICDFNSNMSGILAFVISVMLSMFLFLPNLFFQLIEKSNKIEFNALRKKFKKIILPYKKQRIISFLAAIVVTMIFAVYIVNILASHKRGYGEALAIGNYKEATNLYIDSLLKGDKIGNGDRNGLRQLLALAGDSAQLVLVKKEHYDICDRNYELPWSVGDCISFIRGDSIFMFNSKSSVIWGDCDIFGKGNKCTPYAKELFVTYYDEKSDSSAVVFLDGNNHVVKLSGKFESHDAYHQFIYTCQKNGNRLLYDYQGRYIPYNRNLPWATGGESGLVIRKEESNGSCFVFAHTTNGPICLMLPNGQDCGLLKGRYLIWRQGDEKLYAYDIEEANSSPIPIDNDGYFETKSGVREKFDANYQRSISFVKGESKVVENKTGKSLILPKRYASAQRKTYGVSQNRYYWQINHQYEEIAIFDFEQDGRLLYETKGHELSFTDEIKEFFYLTCDSLLDFYLLDDGRVFRTFSAKNNINKQYNVESYYHFCGNFLIHDEDCQSGTGRYYRKVYSLNIPGAKTIPIKNLHVFGCGDSLIVVNPEEKNFYFYRYETLKEQLERSKIIDGTKKQSLIGILRNR